ncbi:hypothetical protein D3C73_1403780 [compost metagenome]
MASLKYGRKAKFRPTKLSCLSQLDAARVLPRVSIRYMTSAPVWALMFFRKRLALPWMTPSCGAPSTARRAGRSPRICGKTS